ncbi:bifunctional hydroxyacyl-CoA dehydrogenase/enoyl-CoA hydratase fox2 [Fusarium falciforme]|uniref:Bifunctional hydroxyacyl-CoA dehydrogenase/enoyl-CoA hydratase fox2 n=1 Tax=Fusarium falciforme TaxID=195108 RepID=A0A9W8R5Q9_9HYPO|nr:bifunctional hydroxyacyl-CoA dehydrogenase/enoyl-CoA hydratase fox2 [Fusarium falciforme]KAJ4185710.1 bifunctional hydroxyacyl-CoA dehydrogenase/enoyl-CoA hydratase fox2 [Fusarium falciforme]KAJ4206818.1 bifunctional hydroxyacyl-CoA dehydrogenase/enoyl-CoA hydratase fox2 [Fusarium falciforme]
MAGNSLRFDGRVAIVTGSGRGLGREYALLLSRLGAALVINSTSSSTAEATAKEIADAGGKAVVQIGSVADREVANAIVKAAIDNFGRVDIVINNAGGANGGDFDQTSEDKLWDMLGVHVGGSWNVTQAAWPHMKSQKFGRVVMIASPVMFGSAQQSTYGAAKLALMGLAKSIAIEGKEHNILVNTVAPMAYTPGSAAFVMDEQTRAFMEASMPARDVASTVAWLAHESSEVNGETVAAVSRLVTRIFLAESKGYFGPADQDWTVESVRDNWQKAMDETEFTIPTDMAEFGPKIFQRLATRQ